LLTVTWPASQTQAGATLNLLEVNPITYGGQSAYEYIYDIYADIQYFNYQIRDLDTSGLLNLHGTAFYDKWGAEAAGYPTWAGWTTYPSLGDQASTWTLNPAHPDPSLNLWHDPDEYVGDYNPSYGACNAWGDGAVATVAADGFDGLKFNYAILVKTPEGLSQTIRLVHTNAPDGTLTFTADDGHINTVLGPGAGTVPGDLDGDVDADDIDIFCSNMGIPDPCFPYDICLDLDGDGDVDEADLNEFVRTYVEYDNDGDGTPDGVVNATDLQIMKGSFGSSGVGWADGNANCDDVVNATDLQILKGNFGSVASAAPEPLTIGLLTIGAAALLRRRQ